MTPEELDAIETRANSDTSVEEWLEDTYALIAEVRRLREWHEQCAETWRIAVGEAVQRAEAAEARIVALEARPCTTPFTELDARWQDLVARFQDERRLRLAAESRVRELELRLEEERS